MITLKPNSTINASQAFELIHDIFSIIINTDGIDEEIVEQLSDLESSLEDDRDLDNFLDDDETLTTEQFNKVYAFYKEFMEIFAGCYTYNLEYCSDLKSSIESKLEQLKQYSYTAPSIDILEDNDILDPFTYRDYLEERLNLLTRIASMLAVRSYIKKPTLSIIKKGVH